MYFVIESSIKSDNVICKFDDYHEALNYTYKMNSISNYCDYYVTKIIG